MDWLDADEGGTPRRENRIGEAHCGTGQYALVAKCKLFRVRLCETREVAENALVIYAMSGCGLPCALVGRGKNHFIVDLAVPKKVR